MWHRGYRVCRPLSQPRVQAVGISQEQSAERERGGDGSWLHLASGVQPQHRSGRGRLGAPRAAERGGHGRSAVAAFPVLLAGQQREKRQGL